ncbi:hypothetical protein [Dyella japonica]|uniref:Uncharacterized protein n=1 Tax=Dyella japonica A8 TaxID=1217721 RepID=A0A075K165_9GAMM|nr:hypothetical protein [Dyella japonica]AIF46003.1 hypothetical protein HY57_01335 [Dyella japonica A8]
MKQRMIGVVILLLAWFMYHTAVHVPLQQMKAHAPEIKVWVKALVFLPALIGMGLFYLVLGEKMEDRATGVFALAAIPMLALGLWWWTWFEHQKDIYGYGGHPLPSAPPVAVADANPVPNPARADVVPPHAAPPQLPTQELHDLFAAASDSGEARGMLVPGERMRRSVPNLQITDLVRVVIKKGDDLVPAGCSRYHVTMQQGGDVMQVPGEPRVLRPYSLNLTYALNYCLDRTTPSEGYDIHVES